MGFFHKIMENKIQVVEEVSQSSWPHLKKSCFSVVPDLTPSMGESTPFRKSVISSTEIIQLILLNQSKFALSFNLATHSFFFSFSVYFHMSQIFCSFQDLFTISFLICFTKLNFNSLTFPSILLNFMPLLNVQFQPDKFQVSLLQIPSECITADQSPFCLSFITFCSSISVLECTFIAMHLFKMV